MESRTRDAHLARAQEYLEPPARQVGPGPCPGKIWILAGALSCFQPRLDRCLCQSKQAFCSKGHAWGDLQYLHGALGFFSDGFSPASPSPGRSVCRRGCQCWCLHGLIICGQGREKYCHRADSGQSCRSGKEHRAEWDSFSCDAGPSCGKLQERACQAEDGLSRSDEPDCPRFRAVGGRRCGCGQLDNVVPGSPILLKLDTEGHDGEALDGAARLLSDPGLKAIIIELWKRESLHEMLVSHGFDAHAYDPFTRTLTREGFTGQEDTIYVRDLRFVEQRVKEAPPFTVLGRAI